MKTKGTRAAVDCSNSVGNLNSNLLRADKAQPSLCVVMKVTGAQENSAMVMFVMRNYFYWSGFAWKHLSPSPPPSSSHKKCSGTAADLLIWRRKRFVASFCSAVMQKIQWLLFPLCLNVLQCSLMQMTELKMSITRPSLSISTSISFCQMCLRRTNTFQTTFTALPSPGNHRTTQNIIPCSHCGCFG